MTGSDDAPSKRNLSQLDSRLSTLDSHFLYQALALAERGLGRTWPNPTVGCVLVKDDKIIASARTADSGRPHAETEALRIAGDAALGATAYVTLEPCAHFGKTPPCAQALIDAGVARVVIGCIDPDPRVAGRGIAMLEAAGVKVIRPEELPRQTTHDSRLMNRGFFKRIETGKPYVAMKLATSDDYFMARHEGSQWITGEFTRAHGHRLRGQFDMILTGIGTVLADDPMLNVRDGDPHPNLVRTVADRKLRLPITSKLVKSAEIYPLWVITSAEAVEKAASQATELRERGVKFLVLEDAELALAAILSALGGEGITRLLIEAGPRFSAPFLAAGEVNTLHWYRAPITLGNAGKSRLDALDSSLPGLADTRALGEDTYHRYELN